MPSYVALLRAVNVGGTGKLPMSELKAMCAAEKFEGVQTYIASGNVVFSASRSEAQIKAALEKRLKAYMGKPVGVIVRTAREVTAVLQANPFPDAPPNWTYVIFLDAPPPAGTLDGISTSKTKRFAWVSGKSMWPTGPAWAARSSKFPPGRMARPGTSILSRNWLNLQPLHDATIIEP